MSEHIEIHEMGYTDKIKGGILAPDRESLLRTVKSVEIWTE